MAARPRHVLITGGSRGIGLAIAQLFAKNAYRCTLISRSEDDLKAAVQTLQPLPISQSKGDTPAVQPLQPSLSFRSEEKSSAVQTLQLLSSSQSEEESPVVQTLQSMPAPQSGEEAPAIQTLQSLPSSQLREEAPSNFEKHENFLHPLSHGYISGNVSHASNFWTLNISKKSHFGVYLPKPRIYDDGDASRIDVLVNCAGISQKTLFKSMDESTMDKIINTNLTSVLIGTRFLIRNGYLGYNRRPLNPKNGTKTGSDAAKDEELTSPVIINVASLLGLQGGYGAVAYAASKAGVLAFTRSLATEYASHRVRVNAIVPGYVETEMTKGLKSPQLEQRIPLGRFGKPEEIAQAALFLAENRYAHNSVINLDGGLSAM